MNSLELSQLVQQDRKLGKIFIGVYANDNLPSKVLQKPCAIIINTDPAHKRGEHWVAVYFDVLNNAEYFDSYGFEPYIPNIVSFLQVNSLKWDYNRKLFQSYTSSVCGMFCLLYLYFKCRGSSLKYIQNMFTDNLELNDFKVCSFINKTFAYTNNVHCSDYTLQTCIPYCKRCTL